MPHTTSLARVRSSAPDGEELGSYVPLERHDIVVLGFQSRHAVRNALELPLGGEASKARHRQAHAPFGRFDDCRSLAVMRATGRAGTRSV